MTNEEQDIKNRCTFSVISNIEDESGNYIARCTLAYHFTPCIGQLPTAKADGLVPEEKQSDRTKRRCCPLWDFI